MDFFLLDSRCLEVSYLVTNFQFKLIKKLICPLHWLRTVVPALLCLVSSYSDKATFFIFKDLVNGFVIMQSYTDTSPLFEYPCSASGYISFNGTT